MTDNRNEIALITGASRGIGAALALNLASLGYHLILVARTVGALEELDDRIREIGGSATLLPLDVTDEIAIKKSCLAIFNRWKKIDLWIHTAIHAPALSPTNHIDSKELTKTLATNAIATSLLITNLSPLLNQSKNGKAVFFNDSATQKKYHVAYGASKVAQLFLVKSWKVENPKKSLQIIIEEPAPMATKTREKFYPGEDKSKLSDPETEAKLILNRILK